MSKRLVIIDGKSVFYRGYHAMSGLTTSKGTPSGGIYGFTLLALNIIKNLSPDYVCVAWDKSKTNIRSRRKLYPEYKAKRQAPPESFSEQIPILFDLLEAFSWPLYEFDDYEADDIMATLAVQARANPKLETILVSSDLDLLQALGERTKIYVLKKGLKNVYEFDEAEFENKYSLKVSQFRDLKALMGDSSDNVPGVASIGQKKATQLLTEYQDLESIYDHLDDIPEKIAQALREDKEIAFLSRKLVTLMTDAPLELDLPSMAVGNLDALALQRKMRELEFYSLLTQIPESMQTDDHGSMMPQTDLELKIPDLVRHDSLEALEQLDWKKPVFLHAYCRQRFGRGLAYMLASDDGRTVHLCKAGGQLNIKPAVIYGYETKQLVQILGDLGVKEIEVEHDVKVAAFLLNSLRRMQSLTSLADDQFGYASELDDLTPPEFATKAPEIAAVIFELRRRQLKDLKKLPKLSKLSREVEWPFIPVLARLERVGMTLDTKVLKNLRVTFKEQLAGLQKTIYDLAGEEFNLASPSQLGRLLYGKLQVPTAGIKRLKQGYSTDAESLAKLQPDYPIVGYILQWRELAKLQSTYIEGLLEHVEKDGRVYSEMRLTAAATGRLSSANPNLQNIPIKTAVGAQVRRAFLAPAGYRLVSADYSQFELRLAAVLSGEKELIQAFQQGQDIHCLTASDVFEVELNKVTKQQRYMAKTINFGTLYGQGPHSLANLTGMSYVQAKEFISKYFAKRPHLRRYLDQIRSQSEKQGYIETFFGRRRLLPEIKNRNFQVREASFRQAINMPIQGTEADLMKMAMIELDKHLEPDCRQAMQVHDSILVECPAAKAEAVGALMKKVMENVYPKLGISLEVEIAIDDRWPLT